MTFEVIASSIHAHQRILSANRSLSCVVPTDKRQKYTHTISHTPSGTLDPPINSKPLQALREHAITTWKGSKLKEPSWYEVTVHHPQNSSCVKKYYTEENPSSNLCASESSVEEKRVLTYRSLSTGDMLMALMLSSRTESKSCSPALEWTTLSFIKILTARNMKETNRCMWM